MQQRRKHFRTCDSRGDGPQSRSTAADRRSGIAAVWLVLAIPVFAAVLVWVLNVGFLWIARCELENAAVSGALAGVKARCDDDQHQHQHDDDGEHRARKTVEQFIEANCVLHRSIRIGDDDHHGESKKKHHSRCRARIAFGHVDHKTFHVKKNSDHDCACLVQLSKTVEGPLGWFSGRTRIHVRAVAVPTGKHSPPKLVDVDAVKSD